MSNFYLFYSFRMSNFYLFYSFRMSNFYHFYSFRMSNSEQKHSFWMSVSWKVPFIHCLRPLFLSSTHIPPIHHRQCCGNLHINAVKQLLWWRKPLPIWRERQDRLFAFRDYLWEPTEAIYALRRLGLYLQAHYEQLPRRCIRPEQDRQ